MVLPRICLIMANSIHIDPIPLPFGRLEKNDELSMNFARKDSLPAIVCAKVLRIMRKELV
jgi:hypothetical protein